MLDLNDMYYFSVIAEQRSFSSAADALGIPKGTLSKRLRALEQALGVRLAQRTTRTFSLTEAGMDHLEHCLRAVQAARGAEQAVKARLSVPVGRVRISCAEDFVRATLAGFVPEFLGQHPKITLELLTSDRNLNPVDGSIDVTLRYHTGPLEDSSFVARQVARIPLVPVVSPGFFSAGIPATPGELDGVAGLPMGRREAASGWQLRASDGRSASVTFNPRLTCSDSQMVRLCALAGLGVASLPLPVCRDDLDAGRLIRLLPEWHMPPGSLSIVLPSRQGMTPAVRATVGFLADAFPRSLNDDRYPDDVMSNKMSDRFAA
jgi:DNA-binding transcriptional LysR family regulator